ncbi:MULTISPECIES: hypothetical protein [Serratia]|uniref:hypothetical protein n=1 Tax=Serratia TaxID=613 RepID=UPI0021B6F8E5|nr:MULTISPECIES: hypothetical protein [Serratia]MDK2376218.1 hypothetical protein [Serratia fonticola]
MVIILKGSLAMKLGFEKVEDPNGYQGCFYIKNGMKWIHSLPALKIKLNVKTDDELIDLGYDVETYRQVLLVAEELDEMKRLYEDLSVEDGERTYLSDGMYLYPDGSIR